MFLIISATIYGPCKVIILDAIHSYHILKMSNRDCCFHLVAVGGNAPAQDMKMRILLEDDGRSRRIVYKRLQSFNSLYTFDHYCA